MYYQVQIVFSLLFSLAWAGKRFPEGFKFGAATAAYQVEGAWNISDKSPSIWDEYTHRSPNVIADQSTGDIACDSYNLWKEDVKLASDIGLHFYRLSISWPRLLPTGYSNYISQDGLKYYNNLIDGLLEQGIEPLVTLYHWDLPQSLQNLGGWTNPLIVEWFAEYARVVYTHFGDRVKSWLTINEAIVVCEATYSMGLLAPGILSPGKGSYLCNKHVLLAHAAAWRVYDEEFKPKYHGKVSLTNQIVWMEPYAEEHTEITELTLQMMAGLYSHAIFSKEGGWPPALERYIAEKSKKEGYLRSRLPALTKEEIDFIRGTYDFYGLNYYTSRLVRAASEGDNVGPWPLFGCPELNAVVEKHPEWPVGSTGWFYVYPQGLRRLLGWLKNSYGDIEIRIMENGFATAGGQLKDLDRIQYYQAHLEQVLLAIGEDGVNVTHYTAWTLLDNFEWIDGYRTKFGLVEVNFTDPLRRRTPRASALYYADVIAKHSLDDIDITDNYI